MLSLVVKGIKHCLNCECAMAARQMCLYNKSVKNIYMFFCNFVNLSFMQGKIRGDEVKVEKLLIVIFINRQRYKMSLEKQRFSEIYKKTEI